MVGRGVVEPPTSALFRSRFETSGARIDKTPATGRFLRSLGNSSGLAATYIVSLVATHDSLG
jgi:hypothetical protein